MKNHILNRSGKAGISKAAVIAAVAVVAVAVAGGLVAWRLIGHKGQSSTAGQQAAQTGVEQQLDQLSISAPNLDLSVSPLGQLGLDSFDLGQDMSGDLFGRVSLDTDFSPSTSVSLTSPTVTLTGPSASDFNIQAPAQPEPPSSGSGSSGSGSGSSQGEVNVSNCAQFSSMPSAQYCSAVSDPNGRALCEQCKAAGF